MIKRLGEVDTVSSGSQKWTKLVDRLIFSLMFYLELLKRPNGGLFEKREPKRLVMG